MFKKIRAKFNGDIEKINSCSIEIKDEIEDYGFGYEILDWGSEGKKVIFYLDDDDSLQYFEGREHKICSFDNRFSFVVVEKYFEDMETCRNLYSHVYKSKSFFGNEANQIIELSTKNVELKPIVDSYFKIEYEHGATPRNPFFDYLRKLYSNREEYSEALKYLEMEHEMGQVRENYDSLKLKLLKKCCDDVM